MFSCGIATLVHVFMGMMKQPIPTDFAATVQLLATTFSKLNDTDLRILVYLSRARIAFNCIICKHLSIDPSHCHRRLRRLMASGLVEMERVAKRKIYRLSVQRFLQLGIAV
jgi:DNA-binding MarR family transcriptional regulator